VKASSGRGGEAAALRLIASLLPPAPAGEVWIGDDAAVLRRPASGSLLLASDLVAEGVHADLSLVGASDMGWKALAANLSDLAAMGGRPIGATVAVAGPAATDLGGLYQGLAECAAEHSCPVVGGDLSVADQLVVAVSALGVVEGRPVLRSGARPGHCLFVTGRLGASAAGLDVLRRAARRGVAERPEAAALAMAHRRPRPRLQAGEAARLAGASAMIDVSDGLALDLSRLAEASGVGFVLERVPVAEGASLEEALGGGEDYELVFAAPDPMAVEERFGAAGLPAPVRIGTCLADPSERRLGDQPLDPLGWQHPWRGPRRLSD